MKFFFIVLSGLVILISFMDLAYAGRENWKREWPRTDFLQSSVDLSEIISGGPPKDGIPTIDNPSFKPVAQINNLGDKEPVISLKIGNEAKAYPLRVLIWHEIANDEIGGVPVAVTYCPLCNAAIVFDRRVNGKILDFGVSGKLRHSDMIMYDRQSESWWQQFIGRAIVGKMLGTELKRLPARIIPFSAFKATYPNGKVLVPFNGHARSYGDNPYAKYDSSDRSFMFRGRYKGPVPEMSYVISTGNDAWPLTDLRNVQIIEHGDLRLEWHQGMNSALDSNRINQGRDTGFVSVQRKTESGVYEDIPYDMTFAFAFKAFHEDGVIHQSLKP